MGHWWLALVRTTPNVPRADMPTARACLSTSAVNGKIYAIGGTLSKPWSAGISRVEEYDPVTDTWTSKTDMPTRRWGLSTSAVNGKIYAIGGHGLLSTVEEYDTGFVPLPLDTTSVDAECKLAAMWGSVKRGR